MSSRLLQSLVTNAGGVCVVAVGVIGYPAYAQLSPEIANCAELRDSVILRQIEACTAHSGCNLAIKWQKDCKKAIGFLSKLKSTLAGRARITNNDVFEAVPPVLTNAATLAR